MCVILSDFDHQYLEYPTEIPTALRGGISDGVEQCRFFDDTKLHS
jgi:hypothetical protein